MVLWSTHKYRDLLFGVIKVLVKAHHIIQRIIITIYCFLPTMMSSSISRTSTNTNNNNRKRSNYVYGDIIDFDVGGRIFRVRRSLIDSFPSTMLARSAAQVWHNNNNNDFHNSNNETTSFMNATSEEDLHRSDVDDDLKHSKRSKYDSDNTDNNADHEEHNGNNKIHNNDVTKVVVNQSDITINRKPIFIDRDSHRFSYVLDYMRDGGIIELPVTISKDSFIKDLIYYGFDTNDIITDNITVSVPTYEAVLHIESLHTKYQERILSIELEKDYVELSYSIFKQFVDKRNTIIIFRTNTDSPNICKIAQSLAREYSSMVHCQHHDHVRYHQDNEEKQQTSNKLIQHNNEGDISHTNSNRNRDVMIANVNQSDQLHNAINKISSTSSKFILFNKCLNEYGLQCNTIDYESGCSVTMKIASY